MKIGFISDIHGNYLALQSCLKVLYEMKCEEIYCLGDNVGYFSDGQICLERLINSRVECILGNHEAMLLGIIPIGNKKDAFYHLSAQKRVLSLETINYIQRLLPYKIVTLPSGKLLLLVHGSPWEPLTGYVYPDSELQFWDHLPYDYIFMGHTHHAFIKNVSNVCVVNVGSCGLPRDIGNFASFAVYDSLNDQVELIQTPLETEDIQKRYPDAHPSVLKCFKRQLD